MFEKPKHEKDHWWSGAECILCKQKGNVWCVQLREKQFICASCVTLIHDAATGRLHQDQLKFKTKDPCAGYEK